MKKSKPHFILEKYSRDLELSFAIPGYLKQRLVFIILSHIFWNSNNNNKKFRDRKFTSSQPMCVSPNAESRARSLKSEANFIFETNHLRTNSKSALTVKWTHIMLSMLYSPTLRDWVCRERDYRYVCLHKTETSAWNSERSAKIRSNMDMVSESKWFWFSSSNRQPPDGGTPQSSSLTLAHASLWSLVSKETVPCKKEISRGTWPAQSLSWVPLGQNTRGTGGSENYKFSEL